MRPAAVIVVLLIIASLLVAVVGSLATVVYVYEWGQRLATMPTPLYFITPPSPPAYCGDAASYANTYNASFSAAGVAFTLQKAAASGSAYYLLSWPALLFNVTKAGVLGLYLPSGTRLWAGGLSPPGYGYYYVYQLTLSSPISSTTVYAGQVNYTTSSLYPSLWFIYGWKVTVSPPTNVQVLSFVDGQSYQVSPLMYQGDYDATPTSMWPYDLSGHSATAYYWDNWYPSAAAQAVMNMTPGTYSSVTGLAVPEAGAVFWSYSYNAGSNVTLVAVLTYANTSTGLVGHGMVFYLFLSPYRWSVSSTYNFSVVYVSSEALSQAPSPVMGDVIFPSSSTDYLAVQFDPAWAYNQLFYTGSTGPWNVWVVTETKVGHGRHAYYKLGFAPNPSPNLGSPWSGWDGVGSWPYPWVPNAGDYVLVCVRYSPSKGYLYAFAQDLNNPFEVAYLSLSVGGYFAAPVSGTYAFGVGAGNGYTYAADWGLVFVNIG